MTSRMMTSGSSVETTAIESDHINNPGIITQFWDVPQRPFFDLTYANFGVLDPPSGFMGIYTNGVLAASRNDLVSLASVATNYFFLGRSLFAADAPLNGSIDEFRIYRGALNAAAIAANYRNGPNASPRAGSATSR